MNAAREVADPPPQRLIARPCTDLCYCCRGTPREKGPFCKEWSLPNTPQTPAFSSAGRCPPAAIQVMGICSLRESFATRNPTPSNRSPVEVRSIGFHGDSRRRGTDAAMQSRRAALLFP